MRDNLAALDAATGSATTRNPAPNSAVTALEIYGSTVYVGGVFSTIGGASRVRLAGIGSTGVAIRRRSPTIAENQPAWPLGAARYSSFSS